MLDNCSAPYGLTTVKQVEVVLLSMLGVKRNFNNVVAAGVNDKLLLFIMLLKFSYNL